MYIPQKLQQTAVNRWGDRGKKWIQELPTIVKKCLTVTLWLMQLQTLVKKLC